MHELIMNILNNYYLLVGILFLFFGAKEIVAISSLNRLIKTKRTQVNKLNKVSFHLVPAHKKALILSPNYVEQHAA